MKPTTAFRALTANRKSRLNAGGYCVRSLTKKGVPSKVLSKGLNGQEEFTLEVAEALAALAGRRYPDPLWG